MNSDERLVILLEGWLDGGLPEAVEADLLRQLGEDPELRRRFAEQVAMLGDIRATADAHPRWLALFDVIENHAAPAAAADNFEALTMDRIATASRRRGWWMHPVAWGLAAAVVVLSTGVFMIGPWRGKPAAGRAVAAGTVATDVEQPAGKRSAESELAVAVAGSPGASASPGDYLKAGILSQEQGWMTLQMLNGVSVTLEAPFEATLTDPGRIRLGSGVARVRVPDGAEGFRLESPAFEVVDLGTEFAAKVHADGTGTCRVFEGEADVTLLDSMGESKQTRRLAASESVRINRSHQTLQVIEEQDGDYPTFKQPARELLRLAPSYAAEVVAMEPAAYWRFETMADGLVPNEVPGPARMRAAGSASVASEAQGNHSGELTRLDQAEFFKIQGGTREMFAGDFSISFFTQFSWLQNFAMLSAMRFDRQVQGHPMVLQCYASLWKVGIDGSALHAVLRDPPAWDGGTEIVGKARMRPLRWHHVALRRQGDVVTIHLDGAVVARESAGTMPLDCREIFVGRLNGNPGQPRAEARGMVGHIDELAIFPRALPEEAILRLGACVRDE